MKVLRRIISLILCVSVASFYNVYIVKASGYDLTNLTTAEISLYAANPGKAAAAKICAGKNETDSIIGNFIREGGFINVWYSKRHEELVDAIELEKCRKPCKHDSYNIMYESVKEDYLHCNFI